LIGKKKDKMEKQQEIVGKESDHKQQGPKITRLFEARAEQFMTAWKKDAWEPGQ